MILKINKKYSDEINKCEIMINIFKFPKIILLNNAQEISSYDFTNIMNTFNELTKNTKQYSTYYTKYPFLDNLEPILLTVS